MSDCFLSIVIPVNNEEKRLSQSLEKVFSFLKLQEYPSEVLVVENGSTDRTYQLANSYAKQYPTLRVIKLDERGKGLAVRKGMLEAVGEYRFMCDVDFSMPVEEIRRFLPPYQAEYDIAIASREYPGAVRYNEPVLRHWIGRIFNILIRWIVLPGFHDTQCGFKCFHSSIVETLFKYQTLTGWAFDVELLYIAKVNGYRIIEIPIPWYFNKDSRVNLWQDGIRMAMDVMTIKRNRWRGRYNKVDEKQA